MLFIGRIGYRSSVNQQRRQETEIYFSSLIIQIKNSGIHKDNTQSLNLQFKCSIYQLSLYKQILYKMMPKNQIILISMVLVLVFSLSDPYCTVFVAPNCVTCKSGYYINGNGVTGVCIPGNQQCASYTNNGTGHCATCKLSGYTVVAGNCVALKTINPWCAVFSPNSTLCKTCVLGYYINGNGVTGICVAGNQLCASFTNDGTGRCATCKLATNVIVAGNCVALSVVDPYCVNFTSGTTTCQSCIVGFFVNIAGNGKCAAANQFCKTYNILGGSCTSCYYPYHLAGSNPVLCVYP